MARAVRRASPRSTSSHEAYAATTACSSASSEPSRAAPEPGSRPTARRGVAAAAGGENERRAAAPAERLAPREWTDPIGRTTSLHRVRISRAALGRAGRARARGRAERVLRLPARDGRRRRGGLPRGEPRNSPYGYELDHKSLLAANELDDEGFEVGIYHSHPRSPAEPSQTDINLAHYPHWRYVIVSLEGEPEVRAWRIADGRVEEEALDRRASDRSPARPAARDARRRRALLRDCGMPLVTPAASRSTRRSATPTSARARSTRLHRGRAGARGRRAQPGRGRADPEHPARGGRAEHPAPHAPASTCPTSWPRAARRARARGRRRGGARRCSWRRTWRPPRGERRAPRPPAGSAWSIGLGGAATARGRCWLAFQGA